MRTNWVIDQDKTFGSVKYSLISCVPKVKFGSETGEQATTKDKVPQWSGQVLARYKNGFGNEVAEVLKFTIASETDPGKGIPDMATVDVHGLTVGVMEGRDGQGFSVFFRAESINPAASSAPSKPASKADESKAQAA